MALRQGYSSLAFNLQRSILVPCALEGPGGLAISRIPHGPSSAENGPSLPLNTIPLLRGHGLDSLSSSAHPFRNGSAPYFFLDLVANFRPSLYSRLRIL